MKLLLDTCVFLWAVADPDKLSEAARTAFLDASNSRYLSAASAWEIGIKYSRGKLPLPKSPMYYIPRLREESGIEPLPVDEREALHAAQLIQLHSDPFDRLLISQAILHDMAILSPDETLAQYPVRVIW
jgi:PIN domain nuclease of toxin-antitoxin system